MDSAFAWDSVAKAKLDELYSRAILNTDLPPSVSAETATNEYAIAVNENETKLLGVINAALADFGNSRPEAVFLAAARMKYPQASDDIREHLSSSECEGQGSPAKFSTR